MPGFCVSAVSLIIPCIRSSKWTGDHQVNDGHPEYMATSQLREETRLSDGLPRVRSEMTRCNKFGATSSAPVAGAETLSHSPLETC